MIYRKLFSEIRPANFGALALVAIFACAAAAQPAPDDHAAHHPDATPSIAAATAAVASDAPLADQVADLRARLAKLEAQSQQQKPAAGGGMMASGGMGMMGGAKSAEPAANPPSGGGMGMGMMGNGGGMMNGMMGAGMSGGMGMMKMMGMPPAGMKMDDMGATGLPGASHLYHVGSTGFFLDHNDHIKLTTEQQVGLNAIKEKALLAQTASQRKIDAAEEELWSLTAAAQPDVAKIEAKVRDMEKLYGDQRLAFIRAVSDAAKLLTDQQRKTLLGQ